MAVLVLALTVKKDIYVFIVFKEGVIYYILHLFLQILKQPNRWVS